MHLTEDAVQNPWNKFGKGTKISKRRIPDPFKNVLYSRQIESKE